MGRSNKILVAGVQYTTISAALRAHRDRVKVSGNAIKFRLRHGWTVDQAFDLCPPPPRRFRGGCEISIRGQRFRSLVDAFRAFADETEDEKLSLLSAPKLAQLLFARVKRGWIGEQVIGLAPPPDKAAKALPVPVVCAGVRYRSITALARCHGLTRAMVSQRLNRGWSPEQAVEVAPPPAVIDRLATKTGSIYFLWCAIEQKGYVGLSVSLDARLKLHLDGYKTKLADESRALALAIKRNGKAQFEIRVIERDLPIEILPARERHWIATLGTLTPGGYNLNRGGTMGGGYGHELTCEGKKFEGIAALARRYGQNYMLVYARLRKGETPEQAVGVAPSSRKRPIRIEGCAPELRGLEFRTFDEACLHFQVCSKAVDRCRRYYGLSHADALVRYVRTQKRTQSKSKGVIDQGDCVE